MDATFSEAGRPMSPNQILNFPESGSGCATQASMY